MSVTRGVFPEVGEGASFFLGINLQEGGRFNDRYMSEKNLVEPL